MPATMAPTTTKPLIEPHGGTLVNQVAEGVRRDELIKEAEGLTRIDLSPKQSCDVEMIGTGAFSPLTGFMGSADVRGVIEDMRLAQGTLRGVRWPIPITLSVDGAQAPKQGDRVALHAPNGALQAVMTVEEVFPHDREAEATIFFNSPSDDDGQHRHDQDRHPVVEHPAQVHLQRRLKEQRRQEDVEKDIGPDRQPEDRLGHGVQRIREFRSQEEQRAGADQNPEHGKDHAQRQPQARRQRLGHADDDEERGDDRGDEDDIHPFDIAANTRLRNRQGHGMEREIDLCLFCARQDDPGACAAIKICDPCMIGAHYCMMGSICRA